MRQLLALVAGGRACGGGGGGGKASRWMFRMGEALIAGSEWSQRSHWFVYDYRAEWRFMKGDKKQDISCFCCRVSCLTGGKQQPKKKHSQFQGIMPTSHLPPKAFFVAVWQHVVPRSALLDTIDVRFCHLFCTSNLMPPLLYWRETPNMLLYYTLVSDSVVQITPIQ